MIGRGCRPQGHFQRPHGLQNRLQNRLHQQRFQGHLQRPQSLQHRLYNRVHNQCLKGPQRLQNRV